MLSIGQQRLWYLQQLSPSAYNVPFCSRITGPLDIGLLQNALNTVVGRHEVLRTVILSRAGNPFPVLLNKWDLKVKHVDLRALPAESREAEAERVLLEESSRPFNLARDLMLRVVVLQLADHEFLFLHNAPHLAFEGSSLPVLYGEISFLYNAALRGETATLPNLSVQYGDFALWQRQLLQGEYLDSLVQYWREKLNNVPIVDIPSDHPRPAVHSSAGSRHYFVMPRDVLARSADFFRSVDSTLYRGLCAAFAVLLGAYTGLTDIVLGSPFAPRCSGIENLIGFFVNTVALRIDCSGRPSFRELIKRVDVVVKEAIAHSDLTFDRVVEAVRPPRDPSRTPLFQVNFRAPKLPYPALEIQGLSAERACYRDNRTAKFDLALEIETSLGCACYFEYYAGLFSSSTVEQMVADFLLVLQSLIAEPDLLVFSLPPVLTIQGRMAQRKKFAGPRVGTGA
jgi:hypothetical protein